MVSLQAFQLRQTLQRSFPHAGITISDIYHNPSVDLFTELVVPPSADVQHQNEFVDRDPVSDVIRLYRTDIDALASAKEVQTESFLLTGSTGALGSQMLQVLLDSTRSHIYCLNRAADSEALQERRNRTRRLTTDFGSSRVTFLTGDLARPNFGLSLDHFDGLLTKVTRIVHNAWPVNFNHTLQSFRSSLDGVFGLVLFATRSSRSAHIQSLIVAHSLGKSHRAAD
jgi:hypothetical protein